MKKYILVIAVICSSCNTTIKRLSKLYNKELKGTSTHFSLPNKLIIHKDSTFVYQTGSFIVEYAKGFWRLNSDKMGIVLTSILIPDYNKPNHPIDTIYLKLDSVIVKIKSKTTVEMNKELFSIQQ